MTSTNQARTTLSIAGSPPHSRLPRARRALAAVLALLALTAGCTRREPPVPVSHASAPAQPNVLLITLDTTRADHLSAYGYPRPTTPRLAALLPTSVRFDAAYAPMPTTLPSHSSMFTGLYPRTHGVLKNGNPLPENVPTLAEALAAAGYRTAGFVSSFVLDRRFGAHRGFATWDDDFGDVPCKEMGKRWEGRKLENEFCRRGAVTSSRAIDWLQSQGYLSATDDSHATRPREADATSDPSALLAPSSASAAERPRAPFFLLVHLFDPHNPYVPPADNAAAFPPLGESATTLDREIAAYDAEIHYADAQVGHLLDRLEEAGVLDDTLVVVVGDHGEGLMQHRWMHHGLQLYEEAVRVPLLVRWPSRVPGGRTVSAPVELVDLAPTVLDLVQVDAPELRREGRSLARVVAGREAGDPERAIFLQRRLYEGRVRPGQESARGAKLAVRTGRWKYIEAKEEGTRELYDLQEDPGETTNLVDRRSDDAIRMAEKLEVWAAATPQAASGSVSDEDAERLKALGYVE